MLQLHFDTVYKLKISSFVQLLNSALLEIYTKI